MNLNCDDSNFKVLGMKREDCLVPLIMTNGNLYQFGWITLLEPSFPVLHITSAIMDVSTQTKDIAENLAKVRVLVQKKVSEMEKLPCREKLEQKDMELSLDDDIYWRKQLSQELKDVDEAVRLYPFAIRA